MRIASKRSPITPIVLRVSLKHELGTLDKR